MTDDFLTALQADWQGQPAPAPAALRRLKRTRTLSLAVLGLELAVALGAFGVGVWFAFSALATGRLIFTVSAVVLVASTPAFGFAAILARRDLLRWEAETPVGVLRQRRRQAETTLRALVLGWWAIGVMLAFVVVLWMLELGGLLGEWDFLLLYTAVVLGQSIGGGVWIRFRQPHLVAERDACDRLLAELAAP